MSSLPPPRYAFGGAIDAADKGVRIEERTGLGIAAVMARRGVTAEQLGAALGVMPPTGSAWTHGNDVTLVGTGPGTWLALADNAAPGWAGTIETRLAGLASVSDQSGGYTVLRISGVGARKLMARGPHMDFHASAFKTGAAANTSIGHTAVTLWQVDEAPTYDLAVYRSYTDSIRHWLEASVPALPSVA